MIIVIPMAGNGKRFSSAGYTVPKYMIEAKRKTLFEYSLLSLPFDLASKIVFIALKEHKEKYNLKNFIFNKINELNIQAEVITIFLDKTTRGQAETVLKAEKHIEPEKDLIIYNIDTYFLSKKLRETILNKNLKKDGVLSAFYLEKPDDKWSFAQIDESSKIIKTTEKIPVSNYALTGMYHFSKASDFLETAKYYINNDIRCKNEFYVAPMYNNLIQKDKKFVLDIVDTFIPLGTPEDVKLFINSKDMKWKKWKF